MPANFMPYRFLLIYRSSLSSLQRSATSSRQVVNNLGGISIGVVHSWGPTHNLDLIG